MLQSKPTRQPRTLPTRALILLLGLMILSTLLAGCETKQTAPLAASRPTQINRQLAARCPTPGRLTAAELNAVAGDLEKGIARQWQRTAAEYDRLDSEAIACRTGKAP